MPDARKSDESQETRLLKVIEDEFGHALDMARKSRSGEVKGYSNPFSNGDEWIAHAHQLLKMRARILGETVPEDALEHIHKLEAELADVRKEFSEMFRISLENGREAVSAVLETAKRSHVEEVA